MGVDIERRRPGLSAARYFPVVERDLVRAGGPDVFLRLWTRKEAWIKAAGGPGGGGPWPCRSPAPDPSCRCVTGPAGSPGAGCCATVPAPPGHAACVALAGTRPVRPLWPATRVSARPFWHSNIPDRCFSYVADSFGRRDDSLSGWQDW
ncbi:4'-phosphopantetheinyl transferase superfamily protein [Salinispora arenicola]|uniref:4'-phosphopantetheinyl transferase superfamily protein n=1 Tax=Salinispora arenicola TaxID=168697 RepID=UPI0027DD978B|nr:4'-phosphopantetheinyl transferase superfamily protein [Salinispora arenicola]